MKNVKQLSALLIISFLLSIFSFSALAINDVACIHFHPKLITADQVASSKREYDGTEQKKNMAGVDIQGVKYTLYKIADTNVSKNDVEQEDVIGDGPNEARFGKKTIKYYGKPIEKEIGQDLNPCIEINKENYGLYYVVVNDITTEERKSEPVIISVPSTTDQGTINNNIHLYSKLIEKQHNLTFRKKVNGLTLGDENQVPHIKEGNYIMKFRLEKLEGREWRIIKDNLFTEDKTKGEKYGECSVEGLTNGKYRIVELDFINKESNEMSELSCLTRSQINGKRGNKLLNMVDPAYLYFTLEGKEDDKTVDMDSVMNPQITAYIIPGDDKKDDKKYIAKSANPGEDITYCLEVAKPFVGGNLDVSDEEYKKKLKEKYPFFKVHDEVLIKVGLADVKNISESFDVCFVDPEKNGTIQLNKDDFEVVADDDVKDGKLGVDIKFTNNDGYFSDRVVSMLKEAGSNAYFKIKFKVRVQNSSDIQGKLEEAYNTLENEKGKQSKFLAIENEACVNWGLPVNSFEILSNRVRSQFGILKVRANNGANNDPLHNMSFNLSHNGGEGEDVENKNNDYAYFLVPVGKDYEFDDKIHYIYHQGIGCDNDGIILQGERAHNENFLNTTFSADSLAQNARNARKYILAENSVPDGVEIIKQPLTIPMDKLLKEQPVNHHDRLTLPFTGGIGTILFTVIGILLIGVGLLLLINAKRRNLFNKS